MKNSHSYHLKCARDFILAFKTPENVDDVNQKETARCPACLKSGSNKVMTSGDFQLVIDEGKKMLEGKDAEFHRWREEIDKKMHHVRLIVGNTVYMCEDCENYEI